MSNILQVGDLDKILIRRLKSRAARHGRSTEAEHREILRQALSTEREATFSDLAAKLRELTRSRMQTPSEHLLQESRKRK